MRLFRHKDRGKLHPAAWAVILLIMISFLICFMTLSLPGIIGQARNNITSAVLTRLCINSMESGSSLISYSKNGQKKDTFSEFLMSDLYVLKEFSKEDEQAVSVSAGADTLVLPDNRKTTGIGKDVMATDNTKDVTSADNGHSALINNSINIGFHDITNDVLTREYILTNGAGFDRSMIDKSTIVENPAQSSEEGQLPVEVVDGNVYYEDTEDFDSLQRAAAVETMRAYNGTPFTLEQLKDVNFLVNNFYFIDPATTITDSLFDSEVLLKKDMQIKQANDAPQILIYHTHSHENFIDSRENVKEDTVVGIGTYLENILEKNYGYNVIHDKSVYDFDGNNLSYKYAREGLQKILKANPTIEVMIDIHRDAGKKRSAMINGKETAQIMLWNGLCRNTEGPLDNLPNPNLSDNLAFSLQLQLKSLELYPGFFFKNYIQAYRYNLDFRPKSLLIELGTEFNTLESARNAIIPFAQTLDAVLQGK